MAWIIERCARETQNMKYGEKYGGKYGGKTPSHVELLGGALFDFHVALQAIKNGGSVLAGNISEKEKEKCQTKCAKELILN